MGRTETDRKITNEPWSSMHRGQQRTRKTTPRSEGTRAFKKYLTEPTLLEISGNAASKVKSAVPLNVHTSGASTHEVGLPLSCNRSHTLTRSHYQLGSCSRSPLTERACPQSPVLARHRE